jgi:hypothetical protein
MNTLLNEPTTTNQNTASQRLRTTMAAIRVMFTWLGVRKTLNQDQKTQAAETFGAEKTYLSAGKKLLDTSHPAFKAVTAIRSRIISYWKGITLPYPEPGIRLIRQKDLDTCSVQLTTLKADLAESVEQLEEHYAELKRQARERLGSLFNSGDYPATLTGLFDVTWDYPSVEPPEYLLQLSPQLYQQEAQRVAARFDEAVRLAEVAFMTELQQLVEHLSERLNGTVDGKPKVFRDSAVENLQEFFTRFQHLNIRSNAELDELVGRAQRVISGVDAQDLRNSSSMRSATLRGLSSIQAMLDGLLVDRPRRNLVRRNSTS